MALDSLGCALLGFAVAVQGLSAPARGEAFTFGIPPQRIPLNIGSQPITIPASGTISVGSSGRNEYTLKVKLDSDLSDFQQKLTGLLQSELDKDDPCGDRVAIERATLVPAEPSARAVVQLHYERYTCAKALGKRISRKLVGGNGTIQLKFTPAIEDRKAVQLVPEVESIQADGSLGELLRSGSIGAMVREKIAKALLSAIEKGTDRSLVLPPAVQDIAAIDKAQFEDEGSGRVAIVLRGEVKVSAQQVRLLKNQPKEGRPAP